MDEQMNDGKSESGTTWPALSGYGDVWFYVVMTLISVMEVLYGPRSWVDPAFGFFGGYFASEARNMWFRISYARDEVKGKAIRDQFERMQATNSFTQAHPEDE